MYEESSAAPPQTYLGLSGPQYQAGESSAAPSSSSRGLDSAVSRLAPGHKLVQLLKRSTTPTVKSPAIGRNNPAPSNPARTPIQEDTPLPPALPQDILAEEMQESELEVKSTEDAMLPSVDPKAWDDSLPQLPGIAPISNFFGASLPDLIDNPAVLSSLLASGVAGLPLSSSNALPFHIPVPPALHVAGPLPTLGPSVQEKHKSRASESQSAAPRVKKDEIEDEHDDSNEHEEAEVNSFSPYVASGIRALFPHIRCHPDPLVESASLGSVPLPKPDTSGIKQVVIDDVEEGLLSDAQFESVVYATMKFNSPPLVGGKRPGFFLGDGAGVGKGRQIAALIKQHFAEGGTRALWVSVSQDLRLDAERDLDDLNSGIEIYRGSDQVPKGDFEGVVFVTYSLLRHNLRIKQTEQRPRQKRKSSTAVPTNANFENGTTPEAVEQDIMSHWMISSPRPESRLGQIVAWLKGEQLGRNDINYNDGEDDDDFDYTSSVSPLIIFDESHRAKNLLPKGKNSKPTQTGIAVYTVQELLPNAKILYSSATGVSEPRNLAYMSRLGLWGFKNVEKIVDMLSASKLGALELAAMSLKSTGTYLARTLSYEGAEFSLARVNLSAEFSSMYDRASMFWTILFQIFQLLHTFGHEVKEDGIEGDTKKVNRWQSLYWGAHQRFFRSMLMSAKVPKCVEMAREAIQAGRSVVIGIQSTGEAATDAVLASYAEEELDDLISAPLVIASSYIQRQFPKTMPVNSMEGGRKLKYIESALTRILILWNHIKSVPALPREYMGDPTMEFQRKAQVFTSAHDVYEQLGLLRNISPPSNLLEQRRTHQRGAGDLSIPGYGLKVEGALRMAAPEVLQKVEDGVNNDDDDDVIIIEEDGSDLIIDLTNDEDTAGSRQRNIKDEIKNEIKDEIKGEIKDEIKNEDGPRVSHMPASAILTNAPRCSLCDGLGSAGTMEACIWCNDKAHSLCLSAAQVGNYVCHACRLRGRSNDIFSDAEVAPDMHGMESSGHRMGINSSINYILGIELPDPAGLDPSTLLHPPPFSPGGGGPLMRIQEMLLSLLGHLKLPCNPLDDLIDQLGGRDNVAELTGRRGGVERVKDDGFIVSDDDDDENAFASASHRRRRSTKVGYKIRGAQSNLKEKKAFMNGEKLVAIISDAASTGISLQADKRALNQRRRVHITLELPWAADAAVQQFGRSHRANQASAPIYCILLTNAGGEIRFAASAAKRLQSLGALLRGDRNAIGAGSELREFDVDTKEGLEALKNSFHGLTQFKEAVAGVVPPELPSDMDAYGHARAAAEYGSLNSPFYLHFKWRMMECGMLNDNGYLVSKPVSSLDYGSGFSIVKFLNRMLGLPMAEQKLLFDYFSRVLDSTVANLKALGKLEKGILDIKARSLKLIGQPVIVANDAHTGANVLHYTLASDTGTSFEEACAELEQAKARVAHQVSVVEQTGVGEESGHGNRNGRMHLSGFYLSRNGSLFIKGVKRQRIVLAIEIVSADGVGTSKLRLRKPSGMHSPIVKNVEELIDDGYVKCHDMEKAKIIWNEWFEFTAVRCEERCKSSNYCKRGCRFKEVHLLCGAVLGFWERLLQLHNEFANKGRRNPPKQDDKKNKKKEEYLGLLIRKGVTDDGMRLVGIHALNKNEMEFFVNNIVYDPKNRNDVLLKKYGTSYYNRDSIIEGLGAGSYQAFGHTGHNRGRFPNGRRKLKHFR